MATATATISPAVERFINAERAVFDRYGLSLLERFVDLPDMGLRVRVLEAGEGQPILLLPGLGAVSAVWAPLLAGLRGVRAIAVERPGCGLSDPLNLGGANLRDWSVRLVSSVTDALGLDSVSIIGNSIGGTMALWFAIEQSERVARLVLIGAPPFVLDAQAPLPMRILSVPFIGRRSLSRSTADAVDQVFVQMGHPSGVLGRELGDLALSARALPGYVDGLTGLLHAATGLRGRHVAAPASELVNVATPTLMIWGSGDTHGPVATGRRMASTMPVARLEVCGRGHLPWLDEPDRCASLIGDFLSARP